MGQVLEPTAKPSNSNILPEHNASFISSITFQWLQPLMSLGASRPLQKADLYSLSPQYRAADNYAKFFKAWAKERQKPKPSLLRALFRIYGGDYLFSLFLKLLGDLAQISGPLLLQELTIFTSRSYKHRNERRSSVENTVYGYTIPFIFLSVVTFGTFCYNYNYHIATMVGNKLRTCLITGIYRKSFVLSAKARQEFSTGKVVNMMSTDTNRIEMVMVYLSFLLITPLQIIVALILLYLNLGVAALTGFAVMVIVSPSQTRVLKRLISLRKKTAELTDQRVRVTQECVTGIRVIKFFSWENKFLEKILKLRDAEAIKAKILMMLRECVFATALSIPAFASFLSFMTYSLLGNRLTPVVVFSSVAFFNLIRLPLLLLPLVLTSGTDALVSLKRIEKYFLAEEMDPEIMERLNLTQAQDDDFPKVMVTVSDGEFHYEQTIKDNQRTKEKLPRTVTERRQSWYMKGFYNRRRSQLKDEVVISEEKSKPSSSTSVASNDEFYKLKYINLRISRGSLVAIVGTVGSGKSSLLNALIGEMRKVDGTVKFGGTIAYCPQTAWIQNASLKENILFGSPWDAERYAMVINICALQADLNQLPDGDCTEIGERGINLSGGQKQRINLARAVYSDPDIILLDDPLSAVDAHVGKYLFEECIAGPALKNKTRLLVTHQLHLLQRCDWIIVMDQGRIRNQGTLQDLLSGDFAFANIMKEHGGATNEKEEIQTLKESSTVSDNVKGEEKPQALHQEEERLTGAVSAEVYKNYFKAGGGWVTFSLLLFSLILAQLIRVFTDLWLSAWTTRQYKISKSFYIGIYAIWSSSQLFGFMFFGIMTAYIAVSASKVLHNEAIKSLLRSPVSFFDTTPTGRILNRFSKDVDALDFIIGDSLRMFLNTLGLITATFCLISVIFPYFLIPLVPILVFYYFFARYYRHTSRELKRLDSITRSPLYAQFSETLTGLPTIRSYGKQAVFQERNQTLLDENNMAYALYVMTQRWLGLRLESLANLTSFSSMLIAIFLRYQINPSYSALVITYAIQVTGVFNWCVRQAAEVECNLNSVERLQHYITELEHEAPAVLDAPPRNWPSKGEIEFFDVELRYRRDLPLVLRGVSFKFQGGEKIGVVGRTGSGKSTIMLALFRIVELAGGAIHIDGVDISTLGLADLRSKMAIIPQDPMLFEGTFRSNLDPFGAHDDQAIWDALERTEMKDHVKQQLGGLDAKVTEGGENLSVGQRQLLCLCRAMLVQNAKIIVMDEATASVDLPTDTLLQASIRRDFVGCTILTIAHRLNTVMDYDKIIVLEHGKVLEFGAPWELLRRPESALSGMVDQTGLENAKFLRSIAEKSYKVNVVV